MDRLEFAMSLIRAPWLTRLTDRTLLSTLGTALGAIGAAIAAWQTAGMPVQDKANITIAAIVAVGGVVAAWNHGEKKKDREIAKAALSAPAESTLLESAPPIVPLASAQLVTPLAQPQEVKAPSE